MAKSDKSRMATEEAPEVPAFVVISPKIVLCEKATAPVPMVMDDASVCPYCGQPISAHQTFAAKTKKPKTIKTDD